MDLAKPSKPYKDGTPLNAIIRDGWSRGFKPQQTLDEAHTMRHDLMEEQLKIAWDKLTDEFDAWAAGEMKKPQDPEMEKAIDILFK